MFVLSSQTLEYAPAVETSKVVQELKVSFVRPITSLNSVTCMDDANHTLEKRHCFA